MGDTIIEAPAPDCAGIIGRARSFRATSAVPDGLSVLVFAPLRGVLHADNRDGLRRFIERVIDKIGIVRRNPLADAALLLFSADERKQNQILQAVTNGRFDANGCRRIQGAKMFAYCRKISRRAFRKSQLHAVKHRKAAATSSSVANSPRLASASPSSTSGR